MLIILVNYDRLQSVLCILLAQLFVSEYITSTKTDHTMQTLIQTDWRGSKLGKLNPRCSILFYKFVTVKIITSLTEKWFWLKMIYFDQTGFSNGASFRSWEGLGMPYWRSTEKQIHWDSHASPWCIRGISLSRVFMSLFVKLHLFLSRSDVPNMYYNILFGCGRRKLFTLSMCLLKTEHTVENIFLCQAQKTISHTKRE